MDDNHDDDHVSETATPIKGSNFIHRGFNDLLAMLPSGSGTGASAFFTSTHDGSISGRGEDGGSKHLPSPPTETPSGLDNRSQSSAWFWAHMMGEGERADSSTRDATKMHFEKATIHQPAVPPLMIPSRVDGEMSITNEMMGKAQRALREFPATPGTARTPVLKSPATLQSPSRPLPVPGISPARPSVTLMRSPLSPPLSSMATQGPEKLVSLKTTLPNVPLRQPIWEEGAFNPTTGNVLRIPQQTKPAKERRLIIPNAVLGGPTSRAKRSVGVEAVSPAKIDKRHISWPMDFRHVVHASDPEEAQLLLMRWSIDGMGKVAVCLIPFSVSRETPFQTLRVVNGMPSSAYSLTEGSDPRLTTPGLLRNNSAKSPFRQIPNPFESAFSPPTSQHVAVVGDGVSEKNVASLSKITPLRVTARKPVPAVVTTTFPLRQPMTVAPEEIDGLPFPSTPTVVREETQIAEASQYFPHSQMDPAVDGISNPTYVAREVQPSLSTLEKAASTAIFFETLYHALLKPPQMLQAAHPDNYACARERRRLALEEEMNKRGMPETGKETLRKKWAEEETANLRERRRKVGLNSFTKLKVIGHGAFGVVSLVRAKETGVLFAMKELRKSE
ncbi:hypothetical protein QFC21_000353 [Naganishia friedmannii]|uniref:Uncharacterized protein n=1 Tax=Naganishia friedmannii TaxID=89922 RepID=A0ACC2WBK2_9TREE|nr:hypothetical protein QFC21_000353 [Naganishia friedmannii]